MRAKAIWIFFGVRGMTSPYCPAEYESYATALGQKPDVVIVRLGQASGYLEKALKAKQVSVDVLTFAGDYYAQFRIPANDLGYRLQRHIDSLVRNQPSHIHQFGRSIRRRRRAECGRFGAHVDNR